jgi:hypothetical protein
MAATPSSFPWPRLERQAKVVSLDQVAGAVNSARSASHEVAALDPSVGGLMGTVYWVWESGTRK